MMNDFERIRSVTDYRTPSTFRGYCFIMLEVIPIVFSPAFAKIGYPHDFLMALYSCITVSVILVTLNNIMEDLEDPFDGVGVDDLNTAVLTEPVLLMYKPLTVHSHDQLRVSKIFNLREKRSSELEKKQRSVENIYQTRKKVIDFERKKNQSGTETNINIVWEEDIERKKLSASTPNLTTTGGKSSLISPSRKALH
jgi:hypothetical protein